MEIRKLNDIIGEAESIGISGHIRPDGDCVGSCMSVYNYIRDNFPELDVHVYLEFVDDKFKFIKNADKIETKGYDGSKHDLFFAMDSADLERLGSNQEYFKNATRTACIDHHISNKGYADYNYILPNASSACEALFDLLDEESISKEVAESLYLGIAHDSGCFRYSSTSPKTMEIGAKLISKGINIVNILEDTFFAKSYNEQKVTAYILLNSQMLMDGKCIYGCCTEDVMTQFGVNTSELGGVVSELRNIEGTECAVFIYQTGENKYKVSLRSNRQVDVSKIAVKFGGGGHVRASGFDAVGSLEEISSAILKEIEDALSA